MKYILIVFVIANAGPNGTGFSAEFDDRAACEAAAERANLQIGPGQIRALVDCFPKSTKDG